MTVGAIQFNDIFSDADSLRVADASGLAPLSFNPPSPEALGRFLSSMSDDKPEIDSIRLALDSIAQNMSSPSEAPKPVVTPFSHDSRAATIAEVPVVPVVPVAKAHVVESQVVESSVGNSIVVEKPVVEVPIAPAMPAAPVAQAVETIVVEKPVVVAPAAPTTPSAPVAQVVESRVIEKPVDEAPVAPAVQAMPVAPAAQVVEARTIEKPVVEVPVAPAAPAIPTAPVAQVVETPVVEKPVVEMPVAAPAAPATPTASVAQVAEAPVAPVAEAPVAPVVEPPQVVETPAAPVVEAPATSVVGPKVVEAPVAPVIEPPQVVETPAAPVVEAPAAKSEVVSAKPVVAGKRTAVSEEVVVIDLSQESARAATPLREAPFVAAAQQEIAASTASARTESIIEVVNNVAEAIADQILVTPSLVRGEGQMIVRLKPEVLDGSEIHLSSESGTLAVEIVPSTQNAAKLATEAMPRLETALAEHVATFRQVSVSVRKGKVNETV